MNLENCIRDFLKQVIVLKGSVDVEQYSAIPADASLMDNGFDSLHIITLVVLIEEKFGIELKNEDLVFDKINTIRKWIQLLEKYGVPVEAIG